jgi:ligand-binding sensor domain-containing protein
MNDNSTLAAKAQLGSAFNKFLLSEKGDVYLVSNTDGFIEVKGEEVKKYSKDSLRKAGINFANGLRSVKMDTSGQLWIFAGDSIYIFREGNLRSSVFAQNDFPTNMLFSFFLSDGSCLVPGREKLMWYRKNTIDSITGLRLNPFYDYLSVEEDGNNHLWVMSNSGACIFRNHLPGEEHRVKILDGKYCGHVCTDTEGNTWIAPLRDGVYMIPSLDIFFLQTANGLANNNVVTLSHQPDGIAAGFANGSVQLVHRNGRSVSIQPAAEIGGYIVAVFPTRNHQWQIVTGAQLITCDENFKPISVRETGWTKSCYQAADGSLLLGGGFKLLRLSNNELSVLYEFGDENRIYSIAGDAEKTIWLGTEEGLYSLRDSTIHFEGKKFPTLTGRINDLKFDRRGRLWVASSQHGLLLFDGTKCRTMADISEKISGRRIFTGSDGRIYAGTDRGIFIFTELANGEFASEWLRKADGLASEKINDLLEEDGMLWIGTDEGLQLLPSHNTKKPSPSVPIRLTDFTVNGEPALADNLLHLASHQNNIHLSYTGICFSEPHSVIYRYRIQPGDTAWQYTFSSSLDLPDLPPRRYDLQIEAGTSTGSWSQVPLRLSFVIQCPFWKSLWFYALLLFATAGAAFWIIRYLYRMKMNEEARKRKSVEAELSALRSQMNPHFIFNSLNAIQDFIFQHKTEEANEYLSKFARLIRAILNQSRKQLATIEEECDLLRMYLELECLRFHREFTWDVKIGPGITPSEMHVPSMLLQPVVENSIKHGFRNLKREGFLKISFERENGCIRCEVEDNGMGRQDQKNGNEISLGLSITRERLVILNQSLHEPCTMEVIDLMNNESPAGLKTIFRFPVKMEAN